MVKYQRQDNHNVHTTHNPRACLYTGAKCLRSASLARCLTAPAGLHITQPNPHRRCKPSRIHAPNKPTQVVPNHEADVQTTTGPPCSRVRNPLIVSLPDNVLPPAGESPGFLPVAGKRTLACMFRHVASFAEAVAVAATAPGFSSFCCPPALGTGTDRSPPPSPPPPPPGCL
jgi:hypothetical protein